MMTTTAQGNAHANGDCWPPSCPLCELGAAADPCDCRDLTHDALCPENPDPSVCDYCTEPYDPDDSVRDADCPAPHCAACEDACHTCTRPRNYLGTRH